MSEAEQVPPPPSSPPLARHELRAHEIFARTVVQSTAMLNFRVMGQLGLPHAKAEEARTWEENFKRGFAQLKEVAALTGKKDSIEQSMQKAAEKIVDNSVIAFESAFDAASLIFAHSLLDAAAVDWCQVCALAAPDDFMRYISKRKITLTLSDIQKTSFLELRDKQIRRYLKDFVKKSLPEKLDILFALCRPPPKMQGYTYDRKRVVELDSLRHCYVHRSWLGCRLPQGDGDLLFLSNTTTFLFHLVTHRYGIPQLIPLELWLTLPSLRKGSDG